MSDTTRFVWADGSENEARLTSLDDGFASRFSKQKNDLKELYVGDAVKTINTNAFKMCKSLEKVEFPKKLKEIKEFAFAWCEKLDGITLPEDMDKIYISSFSFCSSLKSVVIPPGVTLIDDEAFSYCTSLEEVILPENLECLYVSAFINCTSLKRIRIPASCTTIDGLVFANCESLEVCEFEDGALLDEISTGAFQNCPKLKLENHEALTKLKTIGDRAFEDCRSLDSFTFNEGLRMIGGNAFRGCLSLSGHIELPATLKRTGTESFSNCISIEEVTFKNEEPFEIKKGMFSGCEKLRHVNGTKNVTEVEHMAFTGCTSLEWIMFGPGLKKIGDWAFKGCIALELSVPASCGEIGEDAFAYMSGVEYGGDAKGTPWGACDEGALYVDTKAYFNDTGSAVTKETQLRRTALDLVLYLKYIKKQEHIEQKYAEPLESGLLDYIRGDENEYVLGTLLESFDDIYGTEEFPLSAEVEKFRDRLYIFRKELS